LLPGAKRFKRHCSNQRELGFPPRHEPAGAVTPGVAQRTQNSRVVDILPVR